LAGRYKAQIIEGNAAGYLRTACDYVHLNPVRAGILKPQERLLAYPWSSFGFYLAAPEHRPKWVRVDRLMGEHGLADNGAVARHEFEQRMERRRLENNDAHELKQLRQEWCLGGAEFKKQMLNELEDGLGEHHCGELHRETAKAKAQRIVTEELARLGLDQSQLAALRKSDPVKLAIAARLRRETTLTIKAIAQEVGLGTSKSANARLHTWMQSPAKNFPTPIQNSK
jgi:hypothetical protein